MAANLTRRQALAAGAAGLTAAVAGGAGLVQAGVLPGRYRVGRLLGACDVGDPPPATVAPRPAPLRQLHLQGPGSPGGLRRGLAARVRPAPGDDPFAMLLDELLPLLSGLGLRTSPDQVGVLGWSMGGAGALRLAEHSPDRLAAVVAASPAVAASGPEVAGTGRTAQVTVAKGCHDGVFWQRQAPAQLRFLAAALGP